MKRVKVKIKKKKEEKLTAQCTTVEMEDKRNRTIKGIEEETRIFPPSFLPSSFDDNFFPLCLLHSLHVMMLG